MSPRSLCFSLLAGSLLALPAAADRLIVADPNGFVYQGDTATGEFTPFAGPCIGTISMLAADGQHVYGVNEFDGVLVFDLVSGAWLNVLMPSIGDINSLAAGDAGLFVGTTDGNIVRLDPETGAVLDKRATPDGVRAMLLRGNSLFIGSTNGAIYRADASGGEFSYFSCFCFFNINRILADGGDLLVADEFGTVVRIDATTGELLWGFSLGGQQVASVSGSALLLYYEGGVIPRVNARTGEPIPGSFQIPGADVTAVLALKNHDGPAKAPRSGTGLKQR